MTGTQYDIAIIGAGIVGLATAMKLADRGKNSVLVLEAEDKIAQHQSGHNSGVIHSGLYYQPGSLRAINCVAGRKKLYDFCEQHNIPYERCGKLVIATNQDELNILTELQKKGIANGLQGIRKLDKNELKEFEPHAEGIAALLIPDTGIVDFQEVAKKYTALFEQFGGEIQTNAKLIQVKVEPPQLNLTTTAGDFACKYLINCAGLYSDKVAQICGQEPDLKIIPFRGEYFKLTQESEYLVKNLVYPVPDIRYPFLGVHFTRMINGGIESGPNAVLALKREGYSRFSFSLSDTFEILTYKGFQRMAGKYWKTGLAEFNRSFSKQAFVKALQKLIPEITSKDIVRARSGVRAMAISPDGHLIDDFQIMESERMIHVLNAPSPAATASISIGETIAEKAYKNFGLTSKNK